MRDHQVTYQGTPSEDIRRLVENLQRIINEHYRQLSELLEQLEPNDPLKLRAMAIKVDMEKSTQWLDILTETPKRDIESLLKNMLQNIDNREGILYKILQVLQSLSRQHTSPPLPLLKRDPDSFQGFQVP